MLLTENSGMPGLLWMVSRISLVWMAFHSLGYWTSAFLLKRKVGFLVSIVSGTVLAAVLALILSTAGLLTRPILAVTAMTLSLFSLPIVVKSLGSRTRLRVAGFTRILLPAAAAILAALPALSTAIRAVIPHAFVDPLIIYAARPDRWLDAGHVFWLTETKFSGLPFFGELIALWPAALSSGRVDQLVCLQFFQFSMLLITVLAVSRILRLDAILTLAVSGIVFASPLMSSWCATAKTDMTCVLFTSCGLAMLADSVNSEGRFGRIVPWLLLGLGIAAKLTAIAVLPAAVLLLLRDRSLRGRIIYAPVSLIPVLPFTLATLLRTGEPFYPFHLPPFEAYAGYLLRPVSQLVPYMSRVHESLPGNLLDLAVQWSVIAAASAIAVLVSFHRKQSRQALITAGFLMVFAVTISLVFNPAGWGAKYSVFALPFLAAWSLRIAGSRATALALSATALLLSSPSERLAYSTSFIAGNRGLEFHGSDTPPTMALHSWCNENLEEGAVLVSLWRPERYFSDHEVLVAQNHPLLRGLFEENTADDEIGILEASGADYVYFNASDPLPGDLERTVTILGSVRDGGLLEPVMLLDGYLLCRVGDATL